MSSNIANSFRIALEVANEASSKKAGHAADPASPSVAVDDRELSGASSTLTPLDASIAIIEAVADRAAGSIHPRADIPDFEPIDETLTALCVVVSRLARRIEIVQGAAAALPSLSAGDIEPAYGQRGSLSLENYLDEVERREIVRAIDEARYNRTEAAKRLGITFRALRYRLERLGIE